MKATNGRLKIDVTGIALIGVGSGALEVLLDRGQIDDWFGSAFIGWCFAIAIVCLVTAVFWELNQTDPVIDFRLLGERNFAVANIFYFVFGVGLFGSTTMIPQILQSLYGYRAIDAGLVLGPGAFVITLLAPVGAQLVQRHVVHPRTMLYFAVSIVALCFFHYSHMTLASDYRHYAWARALQGLGYAFFFVPLTMLAYSNLRPDQNNRASSMTNFFRNWGGSFGIALTTTMADRRADFHENRIGANITASTPWMQQRISQTAMFLESHGYSHADALRASYARVYAQFQAQTQFLAFMDCFHILGILTLCAIPLLLFTRKFTVGGKAPAGH